ncbi:MAG TPA: hypothetical protein VGG07_07105 [Solirubrobacteraceae bacterium]
MGETADRARGRTACAPALMCGLIVAWMAMGAAHARAATLSVCPHGCRYSQVADAAAAARNGDTVRVAPGTYRGGFAIDKDLTLAGAGAPATVIRGGGPVITVGTELGATEPTVSIHGVTITRGLTQTAFGDSIEALGGGVYIPAATGFTPGATVTISDSVITDNVAAPSSSVDAGFSCGPTGDCTFAHAGGGGVDSWGDLTLDHAVITNNQAAGLVTSDANGAGVYSQDGTLTVRDSVIAGNRATVANGRFAEGAGIMADTFFSPPGTCVAPAPTCALTVERSVVTGNASTVRSTFPVFGDGQLIDMLANAGGIHVGDGIPTSVDNTAIVGNSATATDPNGEPNAIDSAMIVGDSPLTMRDVSVSFNRASTTNATSTDFGPNGDPLELDGPGQLTRLSLIGNVSKTSSAAGFAGIVGGVAVLNFSGDPQLVTIRDSVISGNSAEADNQTGSAQALGGGVFNNSLLDLEGVQITGNRASASGPTGEAQGGGIWNGVDLSGPPVELTVAHSSVTRNVVTGSAGIAASGGGLFTNTPVTLLGTRIALNRPDQCVGCGLQSFAARRRAGAGTSRHHRPVMATPFALHSVRTMAAGRSG